MRRVSERDIERERERDREICRQGEREGEGERDRRTERKRETERERDRGKEGKGSRERDTDRDRQGGRERGREAEEGDWSVGHHVVCNIRGHMTSCPTGVSQLRPLMENQTARPSRTSLAGFRGDRTLLSSKM